jgi:hypothetical protein
LAIQGRLFRKNVRFFSIQGRLFGENVRLLAIQGRLLAENDLGLEERNKVYNLINQQNKIYTMEKVITNFDNQKDDEILVTATSAITALTGNADFTFTTQLTDLVTAKTNYATKLGLVATGNKQSVTNKDDDKVILGTKLSVAGVSVNLQAGGNLSKLQGSGLPLAIIGSHHSLNAPTGFGITRGNIAGNMDMKVDKPIVTTHGTIFAFWKTSLGATPANINDWFFRHSNGHSLTITGLTPNTPYPFAAAYKGNDTDPLVWSSITTMSPGD